MSANLHKHQTSLPGNNLSNNIFTFNQKFPGSPQILTEDYLAFKKSLKPNYPLMWRNIAFGWLMILVGGTILYELINLLYHSLVIYFIVPVFSLWFSFWL